MTDKYIEEEGHRTEEKASLIRRMWPSDLPEVTVDTVGYPDEELIGYQVSYTVDDDMYGIEIPEDVDDQLDPEEFEVIVMNRIRSFEKKYQQLVS